jgi:hypothetical protein
MFRGINIHGLVGAAVDPEIRLLIAFDLEPTDGHPARDRLLKDASGDAPLPPAKFLRPSDID